MLFSKRNENRAWSQVRVNTVFYCQMKRQNSVTCKNLEPGNIHLLEMSGETFILKNAVKLKTISFLTLYDYKKPRIVVVVSLWDRYLKQVILPDLRRAKLTSRQELLGSKNNDRDCRDSTSSGTDGHEHQQEVLRRRRGEPLYFKHEGERIFPMTRRSVVFLGSLKESSINNDESLLISICNWPWTRLKQ